MRTFLLSPFALLEFLGVQQVESPTSLILARIIDLTSTAIHSASHLFVSASSDGRKESVDKTFVKISTRISTFVQNLWSLVSPSALQRIQPVMRLQDLNNFTEYLIESKQRDEQRGDYARRMALATIAQVRVARLSVALA